MRSNCLFFALALHGRREKRGKEGYLCWRWSRLRLVRWIKFPHVLYGERRRNGTVRLVSYKPLSPIPRVCPPACFKGTSRWGDLG